MTTLNGPDFVALQVEDLLESRRFYEDVIGLEPTSQSPPGAVVFKTQPIPFAIRKPQVDLAESSQLGWGVSLWFHTDDSVTLHDRLREQGVSIIKELGDSPFGKTFTFRDPDGYLITVHDRQ